MLISIEGAHLTWVSIFGGIEHLRTDVEGASMFAGVQKRSYTLGAIELHGIISPVLRAEDAGDDERAP